MGNYSVTKRGFAFAAVLTGLCAPACLAVAAGSSGTIIPTNVTVEGGNVYVSGSVANPDSCGASNMAVLSPANDREMDRMCALTVTAVSAKRPISMWLSGCTATPWGYAVPRAVSMAFG